ncbi:hypothetical protein [Falsibacillus pallidus]|uniref:Uncharacterized protein n=1 Tax=Falsibacillus pallidus TaxID=493781 RepID=A0A370GVK9_9BACI|nr:hypothetical protein [Falsibacillus pallidus]RDI47708.1 hypothetical protein DFR59_101370 [Falsibacillus pallidus]
MDWEDQLTKDAYAKLLNEQKKYKKIIKDFQENDLTEDYLLLKESHQNLLMKLKQKEEEMKKMSTDNEKLYYELNLKNLRLEKEVEAVSVEVNELKGMVNQIQKQLSVMTGKIQGIANTFEEQKQENVQPEKEAFQQLMEKNNAVLADIQKQLSNIMEKKEEAPSNQQPVKAEYVERSALQTYQPSYSPSAQMPSSNYGYPQMNQQPVQYPQPYPTPAPRSNSFSFRDIQRAESIYAPKQNNPNKFSGAKNTVMNNKQPHPNMLKKKLEKSVKKTSTAETSVEKKEQIEEKQIPISAPNENQSPPEVKGKPAGESTKQTDTSPKEQESSMSFFPLFWKKKP